MRKLEFDDLNLGERFEFAPTVAKFNRGVCVKVSDDTYIVVDSDRQFRQLDLSAEVIRKASK